MVLKIRSLSLYSSSSSSSSSSPSSPTTSTVTKNNIIISEPFNFRKRSFKEVISEGDINIKDYINKEWFQVFKKANIKKSELNDADSLLHIFTTIYNYMGIPNGDIKIFKNKPPSSFDKNNNNNKEEEEETCTICLDEIKEKDSIWRCNNCLNCLHTPCVSEWANKTPSVYQWSCPNCRNGNDKLPNENCILYQEKLHHSKKKK